MISFRKKIFSLLMICAFCFSGCTNSSEYYVQGLVNLSSQENNKAIKNFEKAIRTGSSLEVLLSLKELKKLNISKTKMLSLTKIAISQNKKPEDETYNFYLQALIDNQKFEQAIKFSNSLLNSNIKNDWLMYCFCYATVMKEQSLENSLVKNWITQENFSVYHTKFFEEIFIGEFTNKIILQDDLKLILEFRNLVYEKKYNLALEKLSFVLKDFENILEFSPQTISDIGKSFLYGSSEQIKLLFGFESRSEVAKSLKNISSKKFDNTEKEKLFYTNFYAGRICDKAGNQYFNLAKECFLSAIENSVSDKTFDNALWYYLNQLKKESIKSLMTGIEEYGSMWKDKTYFSDLLNELKLHLILNRQWTEFCKFYSTIEQVADEEIKTAWAYLTARLIKEEFVSLQNFSDYDLQQMFYSVLENSESSLYYKIMSGKNLNLESKKVIDYMYLNSNKNNSVVKDERILKSVFDILSSCVKYGQIKKFYEIVKLYKDYLTSDDLSFFAKKIYTTFSDDEDLFPTTLIIASSAFSLSGNGKDLELLQILYPRHFYNLIKESCSEYNLDEFTLLGLIRTESYFDKDVFSVAGASGLTQLMTPTANDIARKLRVKEFNLLDAKTNITFGSFYLNELIRRLDGSVLKAIVSYNSGITRVRRWATQFENVPQDIWIEMFPYEESREYGKKVLANAFVYGLLYYNKTSYEIVDMFMK